MEERNASLVKAMKLFNKYSKELEQMVIQYELLSSHDLCGIDTTMYIFIFRAKNVSKYERAAQLVFMYLSFQNVLNLSLHT